DHLARSLALAHLAAKFPRLLIGQPRRGGVSHFDRPDPEHEDVDALIRCAIGAQRASDAANGILHTPGFVPGPHALLKGLNDGVGDLLVEVVAHEISLAALPRMESMRGQARRKGWMGS